MNTNTQIQELKDLFTNNNVVTQKGGIEILETYFHHIAWSVMKEEWSVMTRQNKRDLVNALLNIDPVDTDDENFPVSQKLINLEIEKLETMDSSDFKHDLNDVIENQCDDTNNSEIPQNDGNLTELLMIERDELVKRLNEINLILKDQGYNVDGQSKTKKAMMKEIFDRTSTRKDFINEVVSSNLAGKAYASTAYQGFKK